jgi:hypothetical protein
MKNLKEIIRKLVPARRRKIRVRAAEIIAKHKARAERAQAEKTAARNEGSPHETEKIVR